MRGCGCQKWPTWVDSGEGQITTSHTISQNQPRTPCPNYLTNDCSRQPGMCSATWGVGTPCARPPDPALVSFHPFGPRAQTHSCRRGLLTMLLLEALICKFLQEDQVHSHPTPPEQGYPIRLSISSLVFPGRDALWRGFEAQTRFFCLRSGSGHK